MQYKLGQYFRGFDSKSQDSNPQLPDKKVSWATIPVRCFVDSTTGEDKQVLLVAFSPRLRYVTKQLAQEILGKYSNFKRIKFLPRRFLPCAEEIKIQVPLDLLIG